MKNCNVPNIKSVLSITLVGTVLFSASVASLATELRMGLITPPQHVWTQTAERFAASVEEASAGEMTIALFPAGQLGNEPAMFQQMDTGLLDMGIMTAAITSQREPSLIGWFSPFLFDSVADAAAASDTPAAQEMLQNLEQRGIHTFGYTFAGMRHILMRDGEVASLSDLSREKVRIIPIGAMQTWWRAAGATPTPVQLPDVYQSLQSRMLDGVDIDLDALVGSGFYEVAEHLTFTNHMAFPAVSVMSEHTWADLSAEERDIIKVAMADALAWGTATQMEAEAQNLAYLEEAINVYHMDDSQSVFGAANNAFQGQFGSHPVINAFQQQVADRKAAQ